MGSEYLIVNPYHDYALRIMRILRDRHDMRAVCLYTNHEQLRSDLFLWPELCSDSLVAANFVARKRIFQR